MRKTARHRKQGFTLIEVLIAGILLAMSIAMMGTAISRSFRGLADANDDRRAGILLGDLLTKIDLIGPARLQSEGPHSGSFDGADARFTYSIDIKTQPPGHLYAVDVTLDWNVGPVRRQAAVSTLLEDMPNSHDATVKWRDL